MASLAMWPSKNAVFLFVVGTLLAGLGFAVPGVESSFSYTADRYIVKVAGGITKVTPKAIPRKTTAQMLSFLSTAKPKSVLPNLTPGGSKNLTSTDKPVHTLQSCPDTRRVVPIGYMSGYPYNAVARVVFTARDKNTGAQGTYLCSAYLVSPTILRTAAHCMAGPNSRMTGGYVQFGYSQGQQVGPTVQICSWSWFTRYADTGDSNYDHGAYKLCKSVNLQRYLIPANLEKEAGYGSTVTAATMGYPGGSNSLIYSASSCTLVKSNFCGASVLYCPRTLIQGGMSGGPTLNSVTGRVVATTSYTCGNACGAGLVTYSPPTDVTILPYA